MPKLVKSMGRAKSPSFYSGASSSLKNSADGVKSKLPLFAMLILGGVAIIFVLRNKGNGASTGPALAISPTGDADSSNIANMIQALGAIQGGIHPVTPGGGASTPIAPTPKPFITPSTMPGGVPGPSHNGVKPPGRNIMPGGVPGPSHAGPNLIQDLTVRGTDPHAAMMRSGGPNLIQGQPGEIRTVGDITRIPGTSDTAWAVSQSQNMSAVDWIKYQYARTGTYVGLYGPNAGAPQRALDAAAIAEAKRQIAAGNPNIIPVGR